MPEGSNNGEKIQGFNELNSPNISKSKENRKSRNVYQALSLPTLCNMNPRSVYNKLDEFHIFVKEEDLDCIFLSESWERDYLTLDKVIKLEDHKVISNVSQRTGKGGRPAIIANCKNYEVQDLTNNLIQIPWGVEAVWCLLTPKDVKHDSKIQKIACCALYSKPDSRKKTLLLDHISDSFNILSMKYGRGLEFVIAGDTNDLNLDPILSLSPRFQQIVKDWTRMDPPALLDPILTTMSSLYQVPECLEPLDADPEKGGKKADHRVVIARAINILNNKSGRTTKKITVRPLTQPGIQKMKNWFIDQTWEQVYQLDSAHEKAAKFQEMLLHALEDIFPQKVRKVNSDDQPWISHKLKLLDRKRKRVYHKERRSIKWKKLNKLFKNEVKSAKAQFYKTAVADLRQKKPSQWYSCLKKITSHDQKNQQVNIDEISHLTDQEQAEIIAENVSSIPSIKN